MTTRIITGSKPKITRKGHTWSGTKEYGPGINVEQELRDSYKIPDEAKAVYSRDEGYDLDRIDFEWFEVTFG